MGNVDLFYRELEEALHKLSFSQAAPPNPLFTFEQQAKRVELEMQKAILELQTKCERGLQLCLEGLDREQGERIKDELTKACSLVGSKEDAEKLTTQACSGKSWSQLLGIAPVTLDALYKVAKTFFDARRFQEAEAAFTYLVVVDHTCGYFWQGLLSSRKAALGGGEAHEF